MTIKNSKYLICLALIFLIPLIGCAGNSRPKTSSDKDVEKAIVAVYLNKLTVAGCDSNKKIKDVPGPLKDYRKKMKSHYGRFLDSKGYKGEEKILDQCSSIDAIDRFFEVFWSVRDPDMSTLDNENKQLIDKRIYEIENEILLKDMDVPGITFVHNGGLRGDMAHVYLFRGNSHYKVKMEGHHLSDLVAWIYFDENQRPMYVFLFYNKGSGFRLFRNYRDNDTIESLMDTLQELARVYPTSNEDYTQLYQEFIENDVEYIFRFAIKRFSYYGDISLEKVLAPPTPESMTAKAIQPKILGVPNIPKDAHMMMSKYFSKITGYSQLIRNPSGEYSLTLTIPIAGIDWEDTGQKLKSSFDLAVSVTNEKTREKKYFTSGLELDMPVDKYSNLYFRIKLDNIKNHAGGMEGTTLSELFKMLTPGNYEIKVSLLNQTTFKSGIWYEYVSIDK